VTITVIPNSAQPFQGDSVQFKAVVSNSSSSAVNWQVNGTISGDTTIGMIDSTGLYTAPKLVPNPPTVTVRAVLQTDSTKTGTSSITIQAVSSITGQLVVSPVLSSVTTSQILQFNILTPGISNTDVAWTVDGGTITPSGSYTPPNTPGPYLIEASLPSAKGIATVEVTNFPGTFTWRNDNLRSGTNSWELALAPATVSFTTFGKLFSCPIDGYAYAQPLYVPNLAIPGNGTHNVVFEATEKDSVYAFDADSRPCVQLWQASLAPTGSQPIAFPNLNVADTNIVPFAGITGTPVIDVNASSLYVVAATQTIALNPVYSHRLYALDLATGAILQPSGVEIASSLPLASPFDSSAENQRPALLLSNGTVYVGFGSYGGICVGTAAPCPYHGWLFGYSSSLASPPEVFDVTLDAMQGGIWQSGGGPSADSNGNVFVATGMGPFRASLHGMNFSDSILKFPQFMTGTTPSVSDFFTPCEQGVFETPGQDLGTGSPVLLPDSAGTTSQPHLLIGSSGNGSLFVINRDKMGKYDGTCLTDSLPRVQVVPVSAGPILSTPLFWNSSVYVASGNGNLVSLPMSGGILASSPSASQSPETLGPQGATPVISSNALSNAVIWLIDSSGALAAPNAQAVLRAYDGNNLSNEVYNSAMVPSRDQAGPAVKFTVPTVANGKVYVGTQTELDVYGLLQ
jgi:hypothetical protein